MTLRTFVIVIGTFVCVSTTMAFGVVGVMVAVKPLAMWVFIAAEAVTVTLAMYGAGRLVAGAE